MTGLLLFLALLAGVPYLNTLANGFVLDDTAIIVRNPLLQRASGIWEIFQTNYWERGMSAVQGADAGLYRPFTVATYWADFRLRGLNPAGYHFTNLLLHVAVTLLLFRVGSVILESRLAGFVAAALFAVHPVHTEAVTNIVGRAEVLATLFFLLALWASRFAVPTGSPPSGAQAVVCLGGAALFYLLGLLSKETAVTFPAVLLVYDLAFKRGICDPDRKGWRGKQIGFVQYALLAVTAIAYFALRAGAVTGRSVWTGFAGIGAYQRVLTAGRVCMEYLGLLVYPHTLSADYWKPEVPIAHSPLELPVLGSVAVGIILGALALYAWRRARPLFFSIAFFGVTILPVSNLLFPIGVAKAERLLYLPSIGFCLAIGWAGGRAAAPVQARRPAAVALAMILLLFGWRTYSRNREWRSDFDLAQATLKVSLTSPLMNAVAAAEYRARGQAARAIPLLQEAIRQRPTHAPLYWELGVSYFQGGQLEPAMQAYREAIRLKPDYPPAHASLAEAYLSGNQFDQAIEEFRNALEGDPDNAALHNNLGSAYTRKGSLDQAIEQYRQAIALRDGYSIAHLNLAGAFLMSNRIDEAIQELGTALKLDPANAQAHHLLGTAYMRKGAVERAIPEYEQAVRLKPDWLEAQRSLEEARNKLEAAPPK